MGRILALFKSRTTLVVAFLGALLAVAVVLQAAESMWHTVSPPEEYVAPLPTTDPEEIRLFVENARPKLTIEGRQMRVGNAASTTHIRFDDTEDEEMEIFQVCLEEGLNRETERLLEELTEIPGGRFARARTRDSVQDEFRYVVRNCLNEILDVPLVPAVPETPDHSHPDD